MALRVLINATPCAVGGAVQVALGVLREAISQQRSRRWELVLAVSPAIARMVEAEVAASGVRMMVFPAGPGSVVAGGATRRGLRALCREVRAELVFTVFGPSYVRFPVPELMGFADGFAITPESGCYRNHGVRAALIARFKSAFKLLAVHTAQAFWVETEMARLGLIRRARVAPDSVSVVPNGVNALFAAALVGREPAVTGDILLLGSAYPHKNHRLIPAVAGLLAARIPLRPWRFVVTLPPDAPAWLEIQGALRAQGLENRCINVGVLDLAGCAAACESASVIFHPSLLEIFSATYVEAMAARRPLVVSDRPFAQEICGDAAVYFDPLDAQSAAEAIARVLTDSGVRERLVSSGIERLKSFPDAAEKNGRLCDLIDAFAARHVKPGKEARSCQ